VITITETISMLYVLTSAAIFHNNLLHEPLQKNLQLSCDLWYNNRTCEWLRDRLLQNISEPHALAGVRLHLGLTTRQVHAPMMSIGPALCIPLSSSTRCCWDQVKNMYRMPRQRHEIMKSSVAWRKDSRRTGTCSPSLCASWGKGLFRWKWCWRQWASHADD